MAGRLHPHAVRVSGAQVTARKPPRKVDPLTPPWDAQLEERCAEMEAAGFDPEVWSLCSRREVAELELRIIAAEHDAAYSGRVADGFKALLDAARESLRVAGADRDSALADHVHDTQAIETLETQVEALEVQLDCSCNAEELRQARAERAVLAQRIHELEAQCDSWREGCERDAARIATLEAALRHADTEMNPDADLL